MSANFFEVLSGTSSPILPKGTSLMKPKDLKERKEEIKKQNEIKNNNHKLERQLFEQKSDHHKEGEEGDSLGGSRKQEDLFLQQQQKQILLRLQKPISDCPPELRKKEAKKLSSPPSSNKPEPSINRLSKALPLGSFNKRNQFLIDNDDKNDNDDDDDEEESKRRRASMFERQQKRNVVDIALHKPSIFQVIAFYFLFLIKLVWSWLISPFSSNKKKRKEKKRQQQRQ